ncbi:5-oxoprolinase subunit PxpB [Salsuginibacillus kocurii]|uniref:5-oxoprolinase subunit PxpB n=1 Tax=Salsuginibacillus kocurii TaxID=427078 RepID=UPI00035F7B99|nr:5-oxoprolinase subunit PxpB [Salsuginibacillus kocurii]
MQTPELTPLGDGAIRVSFGTEISPEINDRVRGLAALLEEENCPWAEEWVPSYTVLTVFYHSDHISYADAAEALRRRAERAASTSAPPARLFELPTYYGGAEGPDLEDVAEHASLSIKEVIERHAAPSYRVYMLGFTPGFPYLGGMDAKLATPRLTNPRAHVPAGSVGIAGGQTGVYSLDSPGGWQLIGRTPVRLYDPAREPVTLFRAGDLVSFVPVSREEYERVEAAVAAGTYEISWKEWGGASSEDG